MKVLRKIHTVRPLDAHVTDDAGADRNDVTYLPAVPAPTPGRPRANLDFVLAVLFNLHGWTDSVH